MAEKKKYTKGKKFAFTGLDGETYKIDDREREFIEHYITSGYNVVFAYQETYMEGEEITKENRKHVTYRAHNKLRKVGVKAYLEKVRQEHFDSLFIDGNRIIEELAKVGFVPVESKYVSSAVKTQALDKLAKIYGLYEEKAKKEPQEIHITIEE